MIKYILSSAIVAVGMFGFGYFKAYNDNNTRNLVEVKGLSEKVVKADSADLNIHFKNKQYENLEDLYKKRTQDKEKILSFLKAHGVTDDEISDFGVDTSEYTVTDKNTSKSQRYFKSHDTIAIKTKQIDKIAKIKDDILKLSSEGVLVTYTYNYNLTNFRDIKLELMKDASENARKNAIVFVAPQGAKIKDVVYLRQGEVSISAADESESVSSWESKEKTSLNKKLRLVVRAGFSKQ